MKIIRIDIYKTFLIAGKRYSGPGDDNAKKGVQPVLERILVLEVISRILFCVCLVCADLCAFTKEEIYENITKQKHSPSFAYEAVIISKIHVQNHSVVDTGSILYSPPDCYEIKMKKGNTRINIIGDTSWITMPDGSVTRKTGKQALAASSIMGNMGQQVNTPDIGDLLKGYEFKVIEEKPGRHVVIEATYKPPQGGSRRMLLTYDTKEWLIRNLKVYGGYTGEIEMGYLYTKIKGHTMIEEVRTVLGPMGFLKMTYENYKKVSKVPRERFRVY